MSKSNLVLSAAALLAFFASSAHAESPVSQNIVPCVTANSEHLSVFRYPAVAKKDGRYGSVQLRVLVDDEGGARTVVVSTSSGSKELDRAARIGARNVSLCLRDGKTRAAPGYAQMQVKFKMNSLLAGR